MFQSLTDKISDAFKKFRNKGKLTESDVKEGMREIKLILLQSFIRQENMSLRLWSLSTGCSMRDMRLW